MFLSIISISGFWDNVTDASATTKAMTLIRMHVCDLVTLTCERVCTCLCATSTNTTSSVQVNSSASVSKIKYIYFWIQVCLDNSDWLGVAKVSGLERIPSYGDVIQLTTRVSSPENCPSDSRFRVMKVRVIETNLYYVQDTLILHVLSIITRIDSSSASFFEIK